MSDGGHPSRGPTSSRGAKRLVPLDPILHIFPQVELDIIHLYTSQQKDSSLLLSLWGSVQGTRGIGLSGTEFVIFINASGHSSLPAFSYRNKLDCNRNEMLVQNFTGDPLPSATLRAIDRCDTDYMFITAGYRTCLTHTAYSLVFVFSFFFFSFFFLVH